MKPVRLHDAAQVEYMEALRRYHERHRETARRFRQEVGAAIATLRTHPEQWPLDPRVPEALGVRRVMVRGFPYSVVFMISTQETVVLAVAHGKRRPGYWRDRVEVSQP